MLCLKINVYNVIPFLVLETLGCFRCRKIMASTSRLIEGLFSENKSLDLNNEGLTEKLESIRNKFKQVGSFLPSIGLRLAAGSAAGLDTCFFTGDDLAWSTACGSVSSLQVVVNWVSLHITRRNWTTLNEKGEVDLKQPWSDLYLNYPLVGTTIIFNTVTRAHASKLV